MHVVDALPERAPDLSQVVRENDLNIGDRVAGNGDVVFDNVGRCFER